ncbi:hypothetical protein ACWED2_16940 [Amycolatopsis sp. NPDC005003]
MTRFFAVSRIAASTVLAGAAVLGGAQAAPAAAPAPSGCVISTLSNGADVFCSHGTGTYRAVTRCDKNNRPDYNRYGPWVTAGNWSSAWCNDSDRAFNQGMQTG